MLLATLPFSELQGSIPFAIKVFHLKPLVAFFWSVIGTSLPVLAILWFMKPIRAMAHKYSPFIDKLLDWVCCHVQKKLKGKETLEGVALMLFVSIPLPGAGAWSGAILAFLLGFSFKRAFPFIFLGIIIAGIIVTLISTGLIKGLDFLL